MSHQYSRPLTLFQNLPDWDIAGRVCTGCRQWKSLDKFYKQSNGPLGRKSYCIECCRKTRKAIYHDDKSSGKLKEMIKNEESSRKAATKKYRRGISWEEYERLLCDQGGRCAICGEKEIVRKILSPDSTQELAVDHDHKTGKIRGLLCTRCNLGIGHFRDNPALLRRAIAYLNAPR